MIINSIIVTYSPCFFTSMDHSYLGYFLLCVYRNLVVTIDLKEESFTPGKKNYEHVRHCLANNLHKNFNVILAWDPPDDKLCPSSVAAWFHKRGYDVKLCQQNRVDRNEYSLKIPVIDTSTDYAKLFEWLGVFTIGGDLDSSIESSYVNSYECPEPLTNVGQVRCIRWTGFITRKQTERIFDELRCYINERVTIPWGSIDVQGFADSPISWELKEHNFFVDGDNSYTIFIKPNGECILRTSLSSNNKSRIFQ